MGSRHVPMFATDCGPACQCGSTLWSYGVQTASYYDGDYDHLDVRSEVDAQCASCLRRVSFETRSRLETVAAVRWNHEEHDKAKRAWA